MADRGHHTLVFGPPVWLAKSHQIDLFEEKTRSSLPMLATGARYGGLIALRAAPKRPHAATCMLARSMGQIGLELGARRRELPPRPDPMIAKVSSWPLLAPNGHAAMSDLSVLSGVNRTSRLRPPTSEFDPCETIAPVPISLTPSALKWWSA